MMSFFIALHPNPIGNKKSYEPYDGHQGKEVRNVHGKGELTAFLCRVMGTLLQCVWLL